MTAKLMKSTFNKASQSDLRKQSSFLQKNAKEQPIHSGSCWRRYGYFKMKLLILTMIFFSAFTQAGEICKDYKVKVETAFNWTENSFNEKTAEESMNMLQDSMNNQGSINTCGLHNSLQIVEGYILKQQAQSVLTAKNAPEVILEMYVGGFCEFIQRSMPCE